MTESEMIDHFLGFLSKGETIWESNLTIGEKQLLYLAKKKMVVNDIIATPERQEYITKNSYTLLENGGFDN